MKKLLALLFVMVAFGAVAQNPSFKSFDTNYFTTNNLIIRVKTNVNSILMTVISNQINVQITNSYNTVGGVGSVMQYTNSSPITEGVFPTASNAPAIAYKRGGLGTSFTWNTVTFTWE